MASPYSVKKFFKVGEHIGLALSVCTLPLLGAYETKELLMQGT